ncbi:hypothetical protein PSAC2689_30013 [Paraburkholderia sacchari]
MIAAINSRTRPVLGERDFNIFLSPAAFNTSAIESNDCRPRLNAKTQTAHKQSVSRYAQRLEIRAHLSTHRTCSQSSRFHMRCACGLQTRASNCLALARLR